MKNIKAILVVLLMGTIGYADAQYYYGPPPPQHREREKKEDDGTGARPTGFFELGFGLNSPSGSFANEIGTGYGGYALPGSNFNLMVCAPVKHSNFGVSFMYSYADNFFDINSYVNSVSIANPGNSYYATTQDAYTENFILGGLYATLPVQRLSFDFRLMGGLAICSLPDVTYFQVQSASNSVEDASYETFESNKTAFATDIGADIRYKFRRVSAILGIDFMSTTPNVSTYEQTIDQFGVTHPLVPVGGGVGISMLVFSLGFGYQF